MCFFTPGGCSLPLIPFTHLDLSMTTEAPIASTSAIVGGKAVPQQLVYCAGEQQLLAPSSSLFS